MLGFKEFLLLEVDDLKLLRRFANKQGVNLTMRNRVYTIPHPNDWYVSGLYRRSKDSRHDYDEPNKDETEGKPGAGSKVLRAINKLADKRKKHVSLYPSNDEVGNKVYAKHGYRWHDNPGAAPEDKYMRRE